MVHTNVFVGNLSFKTRAAELAAEFSAAGKVVEAKIITRGPRSLGYGFVKMDTEEEANKAVTLLSKKSIDGREINVEVAKPRDESRLDGERDDGSAPRGRGGRGGSRGGRGGPRGRGGNRGGRGARGGQSDSNNTNNNTNNNNNNTNNSNNSTPAGSNNAEGGQNNHTGGASRGRPRRFRTRSDSGSEGNHEGGDAAPPRRSRPPRGRPATEGRPPRDQNRTPSTTTLFVANLPFAVDDAGLIELFKDIKISNAHVVKNRNGRSKGFGFVEFENEAAQKAAIESINKKVVDGRELIVKIALTAPENHKEGESSPATSTPAPAEDNKEEKKTEAASS